MLLAILVTCSSLSATAMAAQTTRPVETQPVRTTSAVVGTEPATSASVDTQPRSREPEPNPPKTTTSKKPSTGTDDTETAPPSPPSPPVEGEAPSDPTDSEVDDMSEDQLQQIIDAITNINIDQNIYVDVPDQFWPTVGNLFSLNSSRDVFLNGNGNPLEEEVRKALDLKPEQEVTDDLIKKVYPDYTGLNDAEEKNLYLHDAPCIWAPSYGELPYFAEDIGRQYNYAVLTKDYWGTDQMIGLYEHSSTVQLSWPFKRPEHWSGLVGVEEDGIYGAEKEEGEGASEENADASDADNAEEEDTGVSAREDAKLRYKRLIIDEWDLTQKKNYLYFDNATKKYKEVTEQSKYSASPDEKDTKVTNEVFSDWAGTIWYKDTDNRVTTQSDRATLNATAAGLYPDASEDVRRALNILGYDILLRDEYMTMYDGSSGEDGASHYFGYYYDSITDTYNLYGDSKTKDGDASTEDNDLHTVPITLDYVVQCLYRTMGIYCLNYEMFFFEDPAHTVDTTTLAQTITIAMDQVNEAQNRVDVFVTRTGLDNYWERAVFDNLVTEAGKLEYDLINPPKARHIEVKDNNYIKYKLVKKWYDDKGYGFFGRVLVEDKVDVERKKVLTLAEFCELARSFMNLYGEEVMTKQEEELLLLTYGSLLPYGISDQDQFDAIKYLMAKGIVDSGMAWSDPLTLDDLLIILSRIRDKGSRLTFKEVQITYDPALLERGYYPTDLNFSNNPGAGMVQVVYNQDYDIKEREWIDFFVRMDREVPYSGDSDEYKGRVFSTYFTHYDEEGNAVKDVSNLYLVMSGANDGKGENPKFNKVAEEFRDYDNIVIDPNKVYMGSYAYVHFKVKADCIYNADGKGYNSTYVCSDEAKSDKEKGGPPGPYITINSVNPLDEPMRWQVEACGGIFTDPWVRKCEKEKSDDDKEEEDKDVFHYVVSYSAFGHYGKNFNEDYEVEVKKSVSVNQKGAKGDEVRHIDADDWDELWDELKIVPSQVVTRDEDNYVLTFMQIDEKCSKSSDIIDEYKVKTGDGDATIHLLKSNDHHYTFDEANFDISYVDHQRYETSYGRYLSQNNFLEGETEQPSEVFSATSPYTIIFYVQCDENDTSHLIGDVYWGNVKDGDIAISATNPTMPNNKNIKYLSFSNNKYMYSVNNVADDKAVQDQLHIKRTTKSSTNDDTESDTGTEYAVETISGLAYAKDTFLVSADVLLDMATSNGISGLNLYNGAIVKTTDDAILMSFDTKSNTAYDTVRSSPFTIYVSESLHMISVGNIIYHVPSTEILYYKDTSGTKPVYWLNYRVVRGWASGFTVGIQSTTDTDKVVVIATDDDFNEDFAYKHTSNIANYYTKQQEYFFTRQMTAVPKAETSDAPKDSTDQRSFQLIPMSAPYVSLNCFIYISAEQGEYAVTLKNNDKTASDGILRDLDDDDKEVQEMWGRYQQGITQLTTFFGLALESSSIVQESSTLVSIYPLKNTLYTIDDLLLQEYPDKFDCKDDDKKDYGFFWFDKSLLEWYYVIPFIQTDEEFTTLRENYFKGLVPMPIFHTTQLNINDSAKFINFSSNVISGCPYGVYPNGVGIVPAKGTASVVYPADVLIDPSTITATHPYPSAYVVGNNKELVTFDADTVTACPVGAVSLVMNAYFDPESQTFVNKTRYGYYGNYWTTLYYETGGSFSQAFMSSTTKGFSGDAARSPVMSIKLLGSTVSTYWFSTGPSYFTTTATRDAALQQAIKGELADADDIPVFDWKGFQFDSLVTGSNSVLNVILILVLNILPRIAIFICIALIGLSVIANIKPWRKFCIDVFDIYKGISLGNVTVETVNTQRLLISSIIGLAFFALFMDGTMINVLVWIVKSITGIIER